MKRIQIQYDHALISDAVLRTIEQKLEPEVTRVAAAWDAGYDSEYASLALPYDTHMQQEIQSVIDLKKKRNPTMLILIGIGGSNLGTLAVYESLRGLLGESNNRCKLYCADTVDSNYSAALLSLAEQHLRDGNELLVTIISKSGTTLETIVNAQIFINLLSKYKKNYAEYIVTITDTDSPLAKQAHQEGWTALQIPQLVGGRYSVLSAVGLFPLGILGIDTQELIRGAQSVKRLTAGSTLAENMPALTAAIAYHNYHKGFTIYDFFVFVKQFESIGKWCRQLVGESLGKAETRAGKLVNSGITPTVSVGSIDLHSVAQLYLAGPYDKFTSFISVEKMDQEIQLPAESPLMNLVPHVQNRSYHSILNAIMRGAQMAYHRQKRPFISVELPQICAYYIGQFLQMQMIQIIYMGYLFDVNPFDQPQVELYKKETRKILAHE